MKFTLYIAAALALASVAMAAEKSTSGEASPTKHTSAAGSTKTASVLPPIATGPPSNPTASVPAPLPIPTSASVSAPPAPSATHNAANSVVLSSVVSVAGLAVAIVAAL
ncbi:hypothetical protein EMPS_03329 [Entomortierella parvispora]|uniref:Uncharacterized protein n=1 Tax=Entomortierella parvispora TaxID=205924 RepID=A0A9P3H6C7_9FUNG|nr:hypothetical protein EMPS_03329 [Entomortierella parvispora]